MKCSICGCEIAPDEGAVCPMYGDPSDSAHAECSIKQETAAVKAATENEKARRLTKPE